MYSRRRNSLLTATLLVCLHVFGQERAPVTFGQVTPGDFAVQDTMDSSAGAVVAADVGNSTFVRSGFIGQLDCYLVFHESKRIHIVTHNGFPAATVAIPLLGHRGDKEEITELKATTYNLENGKVVATELDKASVFEDKATENETYEKFTFPSVREGSIVEYSVTIKSPFVTRLHPWLFQDRYPCHWSEYTAAVPDLFNYLTLESGNTHFFIRTATPKDSSFGMVRLGTSIIDLKTIITTARWVEKDVPAFREEPYTTSIYNYVARVEFQFVSFSLAGIFTNKSIPSWKAFSRALLNSDKFGADLSADNTWMDKDLTGITAGSAGAVEKARKIYDYVRNHFVCTPEGGAMLRHSLKTVYRNKTGTRAELNLLLTAMLIHARLNAVPVVLSTRSHGFLNPDLPLQQSVDRVVCKFWSDFASYYLDASDPDVAFGQLPLECYNGLGRSVDTAAKNMDILSADGITEQERSTVLISNGDKGGLDASVDIDPGMAEAAAVRKEMKQPSGDQRFREDLGNGLSMEGSISDLELDSLHLPDQPLEVSYSAHLVPDTTRDLFYFTPTLVDRQTDNPFKSAKREYPVEMPYALDRNYILTMDVPTGYEVEELPKSALFRLDDSSAFFEYIMSQDGDQIHFRTRLRLTQANFKAERYPALRDLYAAMVEKENEQIVFKRKK